MLSKGEKWLLARNSESLIQSWSLLSIMEGIWLELSTKRYEPLENSEWVAKGSEWGAGEEGGAIIVISAEEVQGEGSFTHRALR